MRRALVLVVLAAALAAGCGGGDDSGDSSALPGGAGSRGAQLVSANGCLNCHRIGSQGAGGPGPDLTKIGGSLSREQIASVLVDPTPPMPSFEDLPEADRDAIAEYLSGLR